MFRNLLGVCVCVCAVVVVQPFQLYSACLYRAPRPAPSLSSSSPPPSLPASLLCSAAVVLAQRLVSLFIIERIDPPSSCVPLFSFSLPFPSARRCSRVRITCRAMPRRQVNRLPHHDLALPVPLSSHPRLTPPCPRRPRRRSSAAVAPPRRHSPPTSTSAVRSCSTAHRVAC